MVVEKVEGKSASDISNMFLRMVPTNIIAAAADGKMLGLIFFSLLFGFFITRIDKNNSDVLKHFWQGVFDTMMHITLWVMKFAPLGVFGLVAKTVAATGLPRFRRCYFLCDGGGCTDIPRLSRCHYCVFRRVRLAYFYMSPVM